MKGTDTPALQARGVSREKNRLTSFSGYKSRCKFLEQPWNSDITLPERVAQGMFI